MKILLLLLLLLFLLLFLLTGCATHRTPTLKPGQDYFQGSDWEVK